jgi:preprotein translocase subunit SecG
MFNILLVLQVLMGISIIALVLLQQGKGADMGAAFGAGASGTVFGAGGGGSFFTRATGVLAALFFANSLLLSSPLVRDVPDASATVTGSVTETAPQPEAETSDIPALEEDFVVQEGDVSPSDLPDIEEQPALEDNGPAAQAGEAPAARDALPADSDAAQPESESKPE